MCEKMRLYEIALTLVPGIGSQLGKKLVTLCGSAEAVFRERKQLPSQIPRVGEKVVDAMSDKSILERAARELEFINRFRIRPLFFPEPDYPGRLRNCVDSPVMLYYKGTADLNAPKVIGVVGTRNATDYGRDICHRIISDLSSEKVTIVSGLAYGIDSCAHRSALDNNLPTLGVLGHGLDRIYPYPNKTLAEKMMKNGGLLTEFVSATKPDRENFPMRNRIIAGICDAILIVEAGEKGGALITAEIGNSYNRDVFAVPGRVNDAWSFGTNDLIKRNLASLVRSADDIRYFMGWTGDDRKKEGIQKKIFLEMTPNEEAIVELLSSNGSTDIDSLSFRTGLSMGIISSALLNLEFEGIVKSLPGKVYTLY